MGEDRIEKKELILVFDKDFLWKPKAGTWYDTLYRTCPPIQIAMCSLLLTAGAYG